MKSVRLRKDAFFRRFEDIGLLYNQSSRQDLVCDKNGAVFLSKVTRSPQDIEHISTALIRDYPNAEGMGLRRDLEEFFSKLEAAGFLVSGSDAAELDRKEPCFRYGDARSKPPTQFVHGVSHLSSAEVLERHFMQHPRLYSLQIEVASRCNERCVHCYLPFADVGEMPTAKILDVLDQLVGMGTLDVTFTGGEALLNKDLPILLHRARENDFTIGLLTNATCMTTETIHLLGEVNVALVQISVYSMVPAVHDAITRVPGSLERTKQAIENLIKENIRLQIGCPIMKGNLNSFQTVLQWAEQLNVKANPDMLIMARTDFSRGNLAHRLSIDDCRLAVDRIIKHNNNYRSIISQEQIPHTHINPDGAVCGVGRTMMCLSADGTYYPCPGFKLPLGNARESSVRQIWESSPAIAQLRGIKNETFTKCLSCSARPYCCVCLGRNYNENSGDMFSVPGHFCEMAKLNKAHVERWRHDHSLSLSL